MADEETQGEAGNREGGARPAVHIERYVLGSMQTNTYILVHEPVGRCFIVDPSCREVMLTEKIRNTGAALDGILLTHGHFDHIGAVDALRRTFSVPVFAMKAEEATLRDPHANLTDEFTNAPISLTADRYLEDGETFSLAGLVIKACLTPGHTPGGGCYYIPSLKLMFSGDTLFRESIGRSDFPGGDMFALLRSVRGTLMSMDPDITVLPGHGPGTTIGYEKEHNPYV